MRGEKVRRRRRRPLWCFCWHTREAWQSYIHSRLASQSVSQTLFFRLFSLHFLFLRFQEEERRKEAAETNGSKHIQCAAATAAQKCSPESSLTAAATAEAVKKFGAKARKKEIEKTAAPAMASHCNSLEVSK